MENYTRNNYGLDKETRAEVLRGMQDVKEGRVSTWDEAYSRIKARILRDKNRKRSGKEIR